MGAKHLGEKSIMELFHKLNARLGGVEVSAIVYVFGGAALALSLERERVTQDVDAVFSPAREVREAVKQVARDNGVADDWLNDAGKGYVNPRWVDSGSEIYKGEWLTVIVAMPQHLLAMKVAAAREARDSSDILSLAAHLGLHSAEDVLRVAEQELGELAPYLLQPKSDFLVRSLFA